MIIEPALISPLRWVDPTNPNKSFDGDFAVNQLQWWQSKRCYFQPWQSSDNLKHQIISETQPPDIEIVDALTNLVVDTIPLVLVPTIYFPETPTYFVYENDYSFAALAVGKYYASFDIYTSEPFDVQTEHLNTTLLKYKHSDNDFDVVFDTGIEFEFRVESMVKYDSPKSKRDVYYDQPHTATQLNAVAFRQMKYFVGYSYGVPFWAIDKVSHILQCDQVSFDDVYYQVNPDAEFEVEKNDDNNYIGGSVDIQPKDNNFIKYITTGTVPQPSFKPMQKVVKLNNISGNQTVAGVFKADSKIREIIVYKTGADFTLKIGTTNGGNEIGEFLIDDNTGVNSLVNWAFTGTTTVYLSGSGLNADRLYMVYDQLDEPDLPILPVANADELGKGAKMLWDGIYSDFLLAFDDATGLGQPNTKWSKWCIAGTNGTTIVDGKVHIGIDVTNPSVDYNDLGDSVGSNSLTIARENLPAEGLGMFTPTTNTGINDVPGANDPTAYVKTSSSDLAYQVAKGFGSSTVGRTALMGDGVPMEITPDGIITLFIVKLQD